MKTPTARPKLAAVALALAFASAQAPAPAQTQTPARPTAREFLAKANAQHRALPPAPLPNLKTGDTAYIPLQALIRGQDRLSVDNMLMKLDERIAAGDVVNGELRHDEGRSSVPLNDPISVIKLKSGYVITDGHHDAYLSLYLGAKTIPVTVVDNYENLDLQEAWAKLRAQNLILLPESTEALAEHSPDFENIRDEPNRYLAALLALKTKVKVDDGKLKVTEVKGGKKPVWIKVGNGVPFIEFYLADILNHAGIRYQSEWGAKLPDDAIERARAALSKAASDGDHQALTLTPIISSAEMGQRLASDLPLLSQTITTFSRRVQCQALFSAN